MNLIERVKNIIITPKTEWDVINGESTTPPMLLTSYVIPMALIPAVATFIGMGLIGVDVFGIKVGGIKYGLALGIMSFLGSIVSYYVSTYVIDALAPTFKSEKDINKSAQLVAYSSTAAYVAGIFSILPALSFLGILALYAIYLFYIGLPKLKKTPQDQVVVYMVVGALIIIVVSVVVNLILTKVVYSIVGNPFAMGMDDLFKFK
ncbi:Yip1 family protein [Ferruginibacter sp. SUN002]|uniref:Yip1 family protein n=1 Tax=Ferruginibacter sp. SUN002 TaxID=2937789 RepID=UPI003D36F7CF